MLFSEPQSTNQPLAEKACFSMPDHDYAFLCLDRKPLMEQEFPHEVVGVRAIGYTNTGMRVGGSTIVPRDMTEDRPVMLDHLRRLLNAVAVERGEEVDAETIRASRWDGTISSPEEIDLRNGA